MLYLILQWDEPVMYNARTMVFGKRCETTSGTLGWETRVCPELGSGFALSPYPAQWPYGH